MNYYPNNNFYSSYSYGSPYQQVQQSPQYQSAAAAQTFGLQGKVVDGEEMVKAAEVPFGGYGVFPKADLSEVYIKTWNNNGTTQIINYKPQAIENGEKSTTDIILEKMESIENKLNQLTNNSQTTIEPVQQERRKEMSANAY